MLATKLSLVLCTVLAAAAKKPVAKDDKFEISVLGEATLDIFENDVTSVKPKPKTPFLIDDLKWTQRTKPKQGTLSVSKDMKTLIYTPNPGAEGTDTFRYLRLCMYNVAAGRQDHLFDNCL